MDRTVEGTILPPAPDAVIGSWPLAVSSDLPDLLTSAKLQLGASHGAVAGANGVEFRVLLTFDDPDGWGLPYNFDFVMLNWDDEFGSHEASLDWSESCQNVGVTLFPGGIYSAPLATSSSVSGIRNLRVRLWGRR